MLAIPEKLYSDVPIERTMRAPFALIALLLLSGCSAPVGERAGSDFAHAVAGAPSSIDATSDRAWEPTVAADPRDSKHLVAVSGEYRETPTGDTRLRMVAHVSRDGGASWHATEIAGPPGTDELADPVVLILQDGGVLVAGLAWTGSNPQTPLGLDAETAISTFVARSDDGGASFAAPIVIEQGRGAYAGSVVVAEPYTDKPWLTVGPDGTLLLTFLRYESLSPTAPDALGGAAAVQFAVSTDGGRAWTPPRALPQPDHAPHFAFPAIESDGTWQVAFVDVDYSKDFFHQTFGLWLATSHDRGGMWSAKRIGATPWMPTLRAAAGQLILAAPADVGDPDLQPPMIQFSSDHGATWTAPLILETARGKGRAMVAMDVDRDGTPFVGYYRSAGVDGPADFVVRAVRAGVVSDPVVLDAGLAGASAKRGHYVGASALEHGAYFVWVSGGPFPRFDVAGALVELR